MTCPKNPGAPFLPNKKNLRGVALPGTKLIITGKKATWYRLRDSIGDIQKAAWYRLRDYIGDKTEATWYRLINIGKNA